MGITAEQHRVCIGLYNSAVCRVRGGCHVSRECDKSNNLYRFVYQFVGFVVYFYILTYLIFFTLDCAICKQLNKRSSSKIIFALPSLRTHVNLYFLVIIVTALQVQFTRISNFADGTDPFSICGHIFFKVFERPRDTNLFKKCVSIFLDVLVIFLCMLNITLIIICNPSMLNPGPDSFKIFYNNIQGLIITRDLASDSPPLNMTKVHEMHGYIFSQKPDIIILNETWLKDCILDKEVFPDNYKIFRIDRSSRSHPWDPQMPKKFRKFGGGVIIAHRSDIDISSTRFTKLNVQAELLSVNIKTSTGKKLCISTFYRVGTLGLENYHEFERHFRALALDKKLQRHILVGDFNLNSVSWPEGHTSCNLHRKFVDFLIGDLGHTQLISNPTHVSGNTLDLIFTNIPNLIKKLRVLDQNEACLSDHFGITFDINLKIKYLKFSKRRVYNYRKANWEGLNSALRVINWNHLIGACDSYVAWPHFKRVLADLCDRYIPKKTIRSQFEPPWYDTEVDKIRKKKERWRKRAKASNSESDLQKFRSMRKQFKKTMNEKMRLNVEDDSDPALISKKFWSHVKSKSKSTRIPETVSFGNRFRNNPADQADLFNGYFYEQFSEQSNYNTDIDFSNDRFLGLRFHSNDVFLILKNINSSKAAGPDGIHGSVLKNCASTLARPLSLLFNTSFSTGCIPNEWKLALVVPVFKKGDKCSVQNYRPISLTSLVMKVFERCIKTALYSACEHLLDPRQHGFINNKSCTTQMVPFTNDVALALNNKSIMDIIYFDFAKAFDSVSHDLILHKLKHLYKIDGLMLKFIRSYLEGRQQQVVVGGFKSSPLSVKSGVPQGSILGPLLFVLFINDMFSCISEGTNIALYADDTKIWREVLTSNDQLILQEDINKLYDWSINNKMRFHPDKCKVLSVTLHRNILDNLPFNTFFYQLNGNIIDYVTSQRDLGVLMNNKLNWGAHCDALVAKANSSLGLLKRTCHFTANGRQKRSFYLALVRSIFEHCSVIWSPQYSTHIEKFSTIQKRAVKWINGEQFVSYSDEVFVEKQRELDILPIHLKFVFNDLVLFYKIVNGLVPISLPSYITISMPDNVRYTRRNAPIHNLSDSSTYQCSVVPNSNAFSHSYFYRTMLRWNKVPSSVRQSERISAFKIVLNEFLWSSDTDWPD